MRGPTILLACLGGALLALMLGALTLVLPGPDTPGAEARTNVFVGLLVAGLVAYLASVRLVLRHRVSDRAVWLVLAVAAVMRVALLPVAPLLSSDVYRYVWDGQVQGAGINPYRYVPADPALAHLRDPAVFPLINRATYARTIYPPAAQVIFAVMGRVTRSVTGMKVAMVLGEAVAILCLLRLLSMTGLPRARVLIYAWNPLALWSFACDGHVDAAAIGLLGVALLCRARRRDGSAGAVLAAAALVKFIPVAVAPAFARGGGLWRPALAGSAVVVLLYSLYLSAGPQVLGFLPAYGPEEGLDDGSGFWLLAGFAHLIPLSHGLTLAYLLAVVAGYVALALRIARGRTVGAVEDVTVLCRDTAILAAYATAAISPHYSWYFPWLALPCAIAPVPAALWLSVSPILLYLDPFHERFFWPCLVYLPAIGLALATSWRRQRSVHPAPLSEGVG